MLDDVTAVRFIKLMSSGRTQPILVEVERSDGSLCEVIAKLSSGQCGVSGLVREAMAACLAADLGLPVPEPLLVHFPVAFQETLPREHADIASRLESSVDPSFGSLYIKSLHTLTIGASIAPKLMQVAAEIAVFDAICRNVDRNAIKPNCLTDDDNVLVMIDHELALAGLETLGSFIDPYPWQLGGMSHLLGGDREHILFKAIKGKGANVDRLENSWKELEPSKYIDYAKAIPISWRQGTVIRDIETYLCEVSNNLEGAFSEARRMLS